ncbi:MAG: DUF6268 family outer membrane beta-barrel protein [Mariniblastus sp.]
MYNRRLKFWPLVLMLGVTCFGSINFGWARSLQVSQIQNGYGLQDSVSGGSYQASASDFASDGFNSNSTGQNGFAPSDFFSPDPSLQNARRIDSTRPSGRPKGIPIGLEGEWFGNSELDLTTYDANLKVPLLFGGKSPPPIMKFGFGYTELRASDSLELPDDLYEYSAGLSWVRKLNDRWAVRTMLGIGFATDNLNTSSDSWQFRGGVFAIYDKSPQLKWTFGAIALGRQDLPVVPAIGAVWQPNPSTRFDFILPQPKANFLLSDDGERQNWAYLGVGVFNGNSWGYERADSTDDTLTYSDRRLVAGWQSRPSAPPGTPYVPGRKYGVEFGYAFSRDLEFDNETREIDLGDGVFLRVSTDF